LHNFVHGNDLFWPLLEHLLGNSSCS